jgi:hypothetical protein
VKRPQALAACTAPIPVPPRTRLKATVRELDRILDAMPDPLLEHIERSGLLSTWRSQLETIGRVGPAALAGADALRAAKHVADVMRRVGVIRR